MLGGNPGDSTGLHIYLADNFLEIINQYRPDISLVSLRSYRILHVLFRIMTSLSPLGLKAFPREIRDMIYDFSNVLSWNGETPALIVALRGDQELYREVLELFYRSNTFTLHRGNEWKTRDMSNAALRSIRALKVDFW